MTKYRSKEIEKLELKMKIEKLELNIGELSSQNVERGRMLAAFNQQRLAAQAATTEQQLTTTETQQQQQIIEQIMIDTKQTENQKEDVLFTQDTAWPWTGGRKGVPTARQEVTQENAVIKAIQLYVNHIRDMEARGESVIINEINVVDNVLIHNWGKLLREELDTVDKVHTFQRAKTLQNVRMAGETNAYTTPTSKIRLCFDSPSTDSSSGNSIYGGSINQFAQKDNNGSNGGGSPGGFGDNGKGDSVGDIRNDNDDKRRREFLLVKSYNISITFVLLVSTYTKTHTSHSTIHYVSLS